MQFFLYLREVNMEGWYLKKVFGQVVGGGVLYFRFEDQEGCCGGQ